MMTFEPQDPPEVSTQYCENCHKEAGHEVDDAWLCDVCEKAMDPDVVAYYQERESTELADVRQANRALLAQLDEARGELNHWEKIARERGYSLTFYTNEENRLGSLASDMARKFWNKEKRSESLWCCLRAYRKEMRKMIEAQTIRAYGEAEYRSHLKAELDASARCWSVYRREERQAGKE